MAMEEEEQEEKWVKHYSSNQRILLVGEGDFSFSSSLARIFRSATNIVATSLDTYEAVVGKYKEAKRNLKMLLKSGASTLHGVDATKMRLHPDLNMQKFDRIIFNFPHAGFHGKEDDMRLIERHKKLVLGFFKNASGMLRADGEIHVSHKTSSPFNHWKIDELGRRNSLSLVGCVDFKKEEYPGYNNKRGDSKRCDEPFPLGECSTFKFRFVPAINKTSQVQMLVDHHHTRIISELCNGYSFQTNHVLPLEALAVANLYQFCLHLIRKSEMYQIPFGTILHYLCYVAPRFDYQKSMAEEFGVSEQHQANPTGYQYHQVPFRQNDQGRNAGVA